MPMAHSPIASSDYIKEDSMSSADDLATLEQELARLKEQLPRHSISPSILARIDELEEKIAALRGTGTQLNR
ncbi:MAG: hypothetical protein A2Z03_03540 [Chloroflexi bacterium RBG_16_56_8]|nr:MAG: hypothetical protein A2Z03_03540 [Chloroflexi bacterium RBG_16_56_8]